jgi:hypothetical protein
VKGGVRVEGSERLVHIYVGGPALPGALRVEGRGK